MRFTVKLAIFPPWKAPVPYATLEGGFSSVSDAASAAQAVLQSITEQELAELALHPVSVVEPQGGRTIVAVDVPEVSVHGYVVYDAQGTEVSNETTLDVALSRAAGSRT